MKKIITILLCLFAMLLTLFSGCAAIETDTSLSAILSEIREKTGITDGLVLTDADLLELYGIEPADVADHACLSSMNGIFPDEILMLRAANEDALLRIQEKLDRRLSEVLNQSKSYDAASYAVAQKCRVDVRGLYIALFVSGQHEDMTRLYDAHY